ncbi:hypothetical protein Hanom_Chr15g01388901 [Helianthus anomalus]
MKWPFLLCRDVGQTGCATVTEKDPTVVERCSYRRPKFLEEKGDMAEEVVALKEMYSEEEVRKMYGLRLAMMGMRRSHVDALATVMMLSLLR